MDYLFFLIALLVATITGFLSLYVGQIFGSVSNYLGAFLWGLGVDGALKGFKAIYNQITQ